MTTTLTTAPSLDLPSPIVKMPKELHTKIMYWVRKGGSHECSGMGKAIIENGIVQIVDAWMVKQKNHMSESDMDGDDLARLLYMKRDVPGTMCFWWHSHANMDTFWSSPDRDQIAKLAGNGMCIATVFNNKGQSRTCVAANSPFLFHVDDVKLIIEEDPINIEKIKSWDMEYDDKVDKTPVSNSYSQWGHGSDRDWPIAHYDRGYPSSLPSTSGYGASAKRTTNGIEVTDADCDPKKRLKECYRQLDMLEAALRNYAISKKVCEIIGVEWDKDISIDSDIIGTNTTIQDEIIEMIALLDEEIEILKPKVKELRNANTRTEPNSQQPHQPTNRLNPNNYPQ